MRRLGLALVIGASLAEAAQPAKPLAQAQMEALALAGETAVRHARLAAHDESPLRFEFHRRQAFVVKLGDVPVQVMSLSWWPQSGGDAHCALVVKSASATSQHADVPVIDALAGAADDPPWSCDGEPALRFTDVNDDGCTDLVALFPMRPPSGERFWQPVVLTCTGKGSLAFEQSLTKQLTGHQPLHDLQQAVQWLKPRTDSSSRPGSR
ncbi:hypothetical protein DZC73_18175 [Albitalea terrae]|uniref:Uncharacterized protein n=1 Tax=Piscinibacter terrae TaxID=2496871 RepID=A0A3N7HLT1_9BURK|nr:hypothetical protein DZC73_18175 [Albitalea terrae]